LRRSLAEKASLLAANTPTNAVYAELPTFVSLKGTLGDPKTEINKVVIGGLLARSIGGLIPVGDKASTLLQGVGGLLTGQQAATKSTNAPAGTNAPSKADIVQGLAGLLNQPKKTTNAPAAAATNASPAASIVQGLSGLLNQPKKATDAPTPATNKPAKPRAPEPKR
jgi:hypothetical protein